MAKNNNNNIQKSFYPKPFWQYKLMQHKKFAVNVLHEIATTTPVICHNPSDIIKDHSAIYGSPDKYGGSPN